jgi:hypothetical protein
MSVWLDKPRRRPDGGHKVSGRTTVRSAFQNSQKFFPDISHVRTVLSCRPDGCTPAARNFHIKASRVQTMKAGVQTVVLMHVISIYVAHAFGPRKLASGGLDFECPTCLMYERVRMKIHIVQTVAAIFPYVCFGKKSYSLSNTEWRSDVLLKRPDECKLEQFEGSRHRERSGQKVFVVRTNDALDSWGSGRYITSFGRLPGNRNKLS